MSTRDRTLQSVYQSQEDMKAKVNVLQSENQSLKNLVEEQKAALNAAHSRAEVLEKSLGDHRNTVQRLDKKNETLEETIERTNAAEGEERAELDRLQKRNTMMQQELQRRDAMMFKLRKQVEDLEREKRQLLGGSETVDVNGFTVPQKHLLLEQVEEAVERTNMEHKGLVARLRHENATLKLEQTEQEKLITTLSAEKAMIEQKARTAEALLEDSTLKMQRATYDIQRKEHDANDWRMKYEELNKVEPDERSKQERIKMLRTIEAGRNENERLQRLWTQGQHELQATRAQMDQLAREHKFLKVGH